MEFKNPVFVAMTLSDSKSNSLDNSSALDKAHISLTWLGKPSKEVFDNLIQDLMEFGKSNPLIEFEFGEFDIYGKPEEIANKRGLQVRKCKVTDPKIYEKLLQLHLKYYYHEEGEAEERKSRPSFHVTVGKMSKEDIEKLTTVRASSIYVKELGGLKLFVLEL